MRNPFDLAGRVALVTGANTGIGQAIAIALAGAGADIIVVGRSNSDATLDRVRSLGRSGYFLEADLSESETIGTLVPIATSLFGHIDILVNNAGTIRRADAINVTEADWDDVIDTNLKSLFFLSQAVARPMLERGFGKIINTASMLSFQGGLRVAAYTASKSGVAGLTRLLANEWAARGVNVNAIAPGYISTNNTAALQADPKRNDAIIDRIPAARWGTPDDIAGAAIFLASEASNYVHGHILAVDGGWLAR